MKYRWRCDLPGGSAGPRCASVDPEPRLRDWRFGRQPARTRCTRIHELHEGRLHRPGHLYCGSGGNPGFAALPPSGGGARLRHLWAELSGVPAHFSLRVTLVQSRRAEDGSCLCPGEAELAENRGPVTRTGWERPLRPELRWQALLGDVLGATSLFQLVPRHQQRALRPGQQPPGTLPGGCRPRRSVGLLLFPDADGVGEDGRPA